MTEGNEHRSHPARDQTPHASRGSVSGWPIGSQFRCRQATAYRGHRVVEQEIPEYRAAEGPADERCHHGL